jgi:hypothetical protein
MNLLYESCCFYYGIKVLIIIIVFISDTHLLTLSINILIYNFVALPAPDNTDSFKKDYKRDRER